MAEQAQAALPVHDDGAPAHRIAGHRRQRLGDAVADDAQRDRAHGAARLLRGGVPGQHRPGQKGAGQERHGPPRAHHPKTSWAMVRNHASA